MLLLAVVAFTWIRLFFLRWGPFWPKFSSWVGISASARFGKGGGFASFWLPLCFLHLFHGCFRHLLIRFIVSSCTMQIFFVVVHNQIRVAFLLRGWACACSTSLIHLHLGAEGSMYQCWLWISGSWTLPPEISWHSKPIILLCYIFSFFFLMSFFSLLLYCSFSFWICLVWPWSLPW